MLLVFLFLISIGYMTPENNLTCFTYAIKAAEKRTKGKAKFHSLLYVCGLLSFFLSGDPNINGDLFTSLFW